MNNVLVRDQVTAVAGESPTHPGAGEPLVLLVEDDHPLRQMMTKLLEGDGLHVAAHENGRLALEQAPHLQPDLALLDVNLPGMDGVALCAHLRRLAGYENVPIVMLTGVTDDAAVAAAFAAGATDYLTKPAPPAVFKHKVRRLIETHRAERQRRVVEERLRSVVQYANDAILLLDRALYILELNPTAEARFGLAVGQCAAELITVGRPLSAVLPHLTQTGRTIEASVNDRLGRSIPVELTASVFGHGAQSYYTLILRDITERKAAEAHLRGSEQRLASVLDALADEAALLDGDGNILMVNESWRRFAVANGLPPHQRYGVGLNYLRLCDQADPEQYPEAHALGQAIRAVIAGQAQRFSLEYPCHTPDERRWFLAQVASVGAPSEPRVLIIHRDVTAQRFSRQPSAAVDELHLTQHLLDTLPYGLALLDRRGRIEKANRHLADMCGESPQWQQGRRGKCCLSRLGWRQFKQAFRSSPAARRETDGQTTAAMLRQKVTLRKSDGCFIPALLSLFPIAPGRRWLALVEDVSQQQAFDEILRRHDEEWVATVDAMPDLILLESTEGKVRRCNRAVADFLKRPFTAIIGEFSAKLFWGHGEGSLMSLIPNAVEFQFPNDHRWFRISSYWIVQERGIGTGWVHILSDITTRRRVEQDMRRLVTAIEQVGEGVVTLDRRGRVQFCNPAFEQLTGLRSWEAIGQRFSRLGVGPADDAVRREIRAHLAQGKVWRGHYLARRRDGTTYQEQATVSPVRDARGRIQNVVVVCRDVTEQLRYEAIAEAVNVTENAGYIFSAIRHEMGNPINSIKTALTVLRRTEHPSPETVNTYLDRCLSEIGRVEYLLRTLRSFSLNETPELKVQPLAPFLDRFCKLVQDGLAAQGVTLRLVLESELGLARFDERALHQALMNLVSNAVDAMAGAATARLTITAKRYRRLVVIIVRDTGCGIDAEQMKHIFKPFYTSKPHGTGLGLVITQKLLSKMNGTVELRSPSDGGCESVVTLEAVDG